MSPRADDPMPDRGRILAVDLGDVRIGLALSDPDQIVASPLETLAVDDPDDLDAIVDDVAAAAADNDAAALVVGYPRRLSGREGAAATRARLVADRLRDHTDLPVRLWDERFTTTEAERVMLAQDASRRERRRSIDRVAASIILQGVLEAQRLQRGQT